MKDKNILEKIRRYLNLEETKFQFRKSEKDFTRDRQLPFKKVLIITLTRSVKSLQNRLTEFFKQLTDSFMTPTSSAYSQARKKISYEVFIGMNQECIIDEYYSDSDYDTFMGFRLLATDGSKIYLPYSKDIKKEFGSIQIINQGGYLRDYCEGLSSVMYDVLNGLVIDCNLVAHNGSERSLTLEHLEKTTPDDLCLYDRGYISYPLAAEHLKKGTHFLFRCSHKAFKVIEEFVNSDEIDQIVTIKKPTSWDKSKRLQYSHLPDEITVRLIKVVLDTGEIEILMTSLLDQQRYPTEIFKALYGRRWGVETYYDIIKERLDLENFTGKTAQAVKQDYYATIFISNLESVLTEEANKRLKEQSREHKNPLKVNKSVSFNAIKNHAIELLLETDNDLDELLEKLNFLFLQTPTPIRKGRKFSRYRSPTRSANYYKRTKKHCF